jgi:hypothetical protein
MSDIATTASAVSEAINPVAPHHLPWFMTAPGTTDYLFYGMLAFVILVVIVIGNLYFQLHALPERMAHRANPTQMQVVAVLGLLALFTHNHVFWIAGLLLALVQFPDFSSPMYSMAESLEKLVRRQRYVEPEPETAGSPLKRADTIQIAGPAKSATADWPS